MRHGVGDGHDAVKDSRWLIAPADRAEWARIALLMASALAIRLLFFTGITMGDDTEYASQVISHALSGSWPPVPAHWNTRVGLTLPAAALVRLLGPIPIAFVAWPLLASLLKVLLCLWIADTLCDKRTALVAAAFAAVFPLDVIYSTHLFPDEIVGLFSTLSLWCWIQALRAEDSRFYACSGLALGVGYLCRETTLVEGPLYLALWALEGRPWRPRVLWAVLPFVAILLLESAAYGFTTGNPIYRWEVLARYRDQEDLLEGNILSMTSGGGFWIDPILMALTGHEFGPFLVPSLILAPFAYRAWPSLRPLVIWLILGFAWLGYGTTFPTKWIPLQRDPRYFAVLTVPCVVLVARAVTMLSVRASRAIIAALIGLSLLAAGLDQGKSVLVPHQRFLDSPYARGSVLYPTEYFGARWALGLQRPPPFDCASDLGRSTLPELLSPLEGTRQRPSQGARYVVLSPDRNPELLESLRAEGWAIETTIPGHATGARLLVARILPLVPSQGERAEKIIHPPGLVILKNPSGGGNESDSDGRRL